jgi:hypothetical protein
MDFAHHARHERGEPRYHPLLNQVYWRKAGRSEVETGELHDVSQNGLSLRVETTCGFWLERGDEIFVRRPGRQLRPTPYSIVWERSVDGNLALGCTRLAPASSEKLQPRHPHGFELVPAV